MVHERLARPEVEELVLEEIPDVTYEDVGGLDHQIEEIQRCGRAAVCPQGAVREVRAGGAQGRASLRPTRMWQDAHRQGGGQQPRPGRGGADRRSDARSYFLNIKGPELLNKYVGETERQIRLIFQRAKEKSEEGVPVIVFFDEMDSLFRTRGSGISSDVESTIVPQLLSELDGVEKLKNVIVIGASNREDLIDPAILRPGRLDVKIKISRPDERGGPPDLPHLPPETSSLRSSHRAGPVTMATARLWWRR